MRQFSESVLYDLLEPHEPPCVSIYQPTHRHYPGTAVDRIYFRNLLRQAAESLRRKYPSRVVNSVMSVPRGYEHNVEFWNHQADGLAVFASPDSFRLVQFQRPVPATVVAADSFHVKPLVRILQSADRYQVLCLTRSGVSLYEGNRYALDEVELDWRAPRDPIEVLAGKAATDAASREFAPRSRRAPVGRSRTTDDDNSHGDAGGQVADGVEAQYVRFFREVDRAVWKYHSRDSGLPLILAALPQHQAIFRHVSHNPRLTEPGLKLNPGGMNADHLREEAWRVFEPRYKARVAATTDRFRVARSRGAASADLSEVGAAAVSARVGLLLVDAERHAPGSLDPSSGRVVLGELHDPDVDDVLDDMAERVLRTGGEVFALPRIEMPTDTGVAAVYRF